MQIIELYGLPGCGKSTTRQLLLDEPPESDILTVIDVAQGFKQQNLWKKIKCLPLLAWLKLIILILRLPVLPIKDWRIYRHMFVVVLLYTYAQKQREGCLVVDHGIVQDVVGVLYGHSDHITRGALKMLCKLMLIMESVIFVFCEIDKETSLQRIRLRNRKGEGRLDAISDDTILIKELTIQNSIFKNIYYNLFSCKSSTSCKVAMEKEQGIVKKEIIRIIEKIYA